MRVAAALIASIALAGCATAKKHMAACEMSIGQQNAAAYAAVEHQFGKPPLGYDWHIKYPRDRDAGGRIVLEAYNIYPVVDPPLEVAPVGRKLTVIVDPCSRRTIKVFQPA